MKFLDVGLLRYIVAGLATGNGILFVLVETVPLQLMTITILSINSAFRVIKGFERVLLEEMDLVVLINKRSDKFLFPMNLLSQNLVLLPEPSILLLQLRTLILNALATAHQILHPKPQFLIFLSQQLFLFLEQSYTFP